MHKDALLS